MGSPKKKDQIRKKKPALIETWGIAGEKKRSCQRGPTGRGNLQGSLLVKTGGEQA